MKTNVPSESGFVILQFCLKANYKAEKEGETIEVMENMLTVVKHIVVSPNYCKLATTLAGDRSAPVTLVVNVLV